jgi:vacuolar protein sorting-associated protein 13A/C
MEHILQYILPSILGDFIQGIDKNHMKTNFLSGKVTLQGVSLNPAIVKSLNLPTKMIYSSIGKFEIKIPWLQRLKQPIEIYLEDLFVILEPTSTLEDFDIVEERIKFLEALTKECRNQLRNLNQDGSKEAASSMDYYKVLILDNMQVKKIFV